ncbi:sugar phosphate isomerase/epimerase family protein [Lapillicoccus jejuensis]|uniref:Xylose isomerase n=1 Tax=Lapillicoccus jejuensis TaxID=402171 RepID=A0A542E0Z3_9MICO|nr:sugar phosphate isomerase/epimerase family protein [Lapillicoccus jejuensis]TQJ09018.1 xylose isomerase [Lapillicoccus jejuensis]
MTSTAQPHFATRLNSFALGGGLAHPRERPSTLDLVATAGTVEGLTALEVNYPEHFVDTTPSELGGAIEEAGLTNTGIQVRWPAPHFADGGFTHPAKSVREDAVRTATEAVDVAREMGCDHVVLWPAHDGYEYPFQMDYRSAWQQAVEGYRAVADHCPDVTVSIEFKPAEPRARTLLAGTGSVLALVAEAGRDNLAVTLDLAHLFMARENPAQSVALCLAQGRLRGLQLNDGWGAADDGLVTGSVDLVQTLETFFYLLRDGYTGTFYFDTDPIREDPVRECATNIARTKQLLQIAGSLVEGGRLPDPDALSGGAVWWEALVRS